MTALPFVHDDGGRAAAGRRGDAGDCLTRAIAIATGKPYAEVYELVNDAGKGERTRKRRNGTTRPKSSARTGVYTATARRIMEGLGWTWVPTMEIGSGCKVHLAAGELPAGRIIARVSRHFVAVIDGVMHDNHDPSRDGTRCVYGYYQPGEATDGT
jgi:hypothetical protein